MRASIYWHYFRADIREKNIFSVNIPSVGLVKETDYCGLASGARADKVAMS